MTTDYYYLHTNGDLIHKPGSYDECNFRDSDLVVHYWRLDNGDRESAWTFLVEALSKKVTNVKRVLELAAKWGCNNEDAAIYAERIGLRLFKDGNQWVATKNDFTNLQNSPAGFGDTALEAMGALARELEFRTTKLYWHHSFPAFIKAHTKGTESPCSTSR